MPDHRGHVYKGHSGHVHKGLSGWWVWSCQDCSSRSLLQSWQEAITLNDKHRSFHDARNS